MGPFGFIAFLSLMGAGIVRGVQVLRLHTRDRSAPLLVACVSLILMVAVYNWVDLGLVNLRLTAFAGLAFGVIGAWNRYGTQVTHTPDREQQLVSYGVARTVVHQFEAVQVEKEDGDIGYPLRSSGDGLVQAVHKEFAVGEPR